MELGSNSARIQHSRGDTRDREKQNVQYVLPLRGLFPEGPEPAQERDLDVGERVHVGVPEADGSL